MTYVDGFLVPVPKKNAAAYKKLARLGAKIWMEHGALSYFECEADDVPEGKLSSFTKAVKLKPGEVVYFSWITYKSRAHRDAVMKKVMADPRLSPGKKPMPFDMKRMIFGGFKSVVEG